MSTVDAFVRGRGTGTGPTRRRWIGPVLAGAVLLAVGLLMLQPPVTGEPYDPTSAGPTGLRGVVDVLQALGAGVEVTDDLEVAGRADAVLVPPLGWTEEQVLALAEAGATVLAELPPDPGAVPTPLGVGGVGLVDLRPDCDLLADVTTLRSSVWPAFTLPTGVAATDRCVVRGDAAWLHVLPVGAGRLVSVGSMAPFSNQRLVDSDAGLATARILAPTGTETVAVLGDPPGTPPPGLLDLVDRRWFDAAWLSLAALVVLALARGRRLGGPVSEQLPVRVPSGELARAIGDLRHRAGHQARAAEELRSAVLEDARRRLGLARDADGAAVLEALRRRGAAVSDEQTRALTGELPQEPDDLVVCAGRLAELRATLRDPRPDPTEQR